MGLPLDFILTLGTLMLLGGIALIADAGRRGIRRFQASLNESPKSPTIQRVTPHHLRNEFRSAARAASKL